ncbi:MAG: hypothetical protein FD180_1199 [Planctomycetota bacterium]|nr:MAG: hypothetical protein FD180_1199 [Planctomycetota bacterium]
MPLDATSPELWNKVIASAVVPVVMISACGLLTSAFYNRLTAILARLRALGLEAMKDQEAVVAKPKPGETNSFVRARSRVRAEARQRQADELLWRARMLRGSVAFMLTAIGLLVLTSLAIGAGVFWPAAVYIAGALFICGLSSVLGAVLLALVEVRHALGPIEMEHEMVVKLGKEMPGEAARPPDILHHPDQD